MTLNELRYIVAVARERHFGRAAAACFVSQPTLSVAVKKLEEELGVALFERGRQEITPTAVGEQVVTHAQQALEDVERLRNAAQTGRDPLAGPLRLGAIYTIGPYLLPHLIPVLHERVPQMPLVIEENFTARLGERLKRGDLDVIVIALPFEEPGVTTRALYDEPFVALLPSGHPMTRSDTVSPEELRQETVLLLGKGHCFRDQVLEFCPGCAETAANGLQKGLEGGSLETIRHMVAGGIGVTVLPCTAAGAHGYSQRLLAIRRFAGVAPKRRIALAWRKGFPRGEAVEALYNGILACNISCIHEIGETLHG